MTEDELAAADLYDPPLVPAGSFTLRGFATPVDAFTPAATPDARP